MAGNAVWWNYSRKQNIVEPFVGYIIDDPRMHGFGDWLLGIRDSGKKYNDGRFGYMGEGFENLTRNLLSASNSFFENSSALADITGRQVIAELKKIQQQSFEKEQRFYKAFNCNSLENFNMIWQGHQDLTEEDYWVYKVLSYFSGENLRLIGSKGRTEIERLLSLTAIQLEEIKTEGLEKYKNQVKKDLTIGVDAVLQELQPGEGHNTSVYNIFVKEDGILNEDFLSVIFDSLQREIMTEDVEKKMEDTRMSIEQAIVNTIQDLFGGTEGRFEVTNNGRKNLRTRITDSEGNSYKGLTAYFVNWHGGSQEKVTKSIIEFIDKIMAVHMPQGGKDTIPSWNAWLVNKDKTVERIERMLKDFFSNHPIEKYADYTVSVNNISQIQGLFGEIQTYGRNYFNLEKFADNEKISINVLNLANAMNERSKLSGVDILVTATDKMTGQTEAFGFQVKNPFTTDNGYYETYTQKWQLGTTEADNLFQNYFGWGPNSSERISFEMLNANLKNSQKPLTVVNTVKKILLLYSPQFARLTMEKIRNDQLEDNEQHILSLIGNQVQNTFFILKGEIIPVSDIIGGLIEQYEIVLGLARKDKEQPTLKIYYRNTNQKNLVDPKEYEGTNLMGIMRKSDNDTKNTNYTRRYYRYDPSKILIGSQYENTLNQISFNTALRLKIPSIEELSYLRKIKKR